MNLEPDMPPRGFDEPTNPGRLFAAVARHWRSLRQRFWLSLFFDVVLIGLALAAVHAFQTRNLPIGGPAPQAQLQRLDGQGPARAAGPEGVGVVYFFAPWCGICRNSIGNLDALVANGSVAWVSAVALDWEHPGEVAAFVRETGLQAPVLLGDGTTAADWGVTAFPTYFVVGDGGFLAARSVGYSTRLGLEFRTWMAR